MPELTASPSERSGSSRWFARRFWWSRRKTPGEGKAAGSRDRRKQIVTWALVIGFIAGFFDLPLPIEDTLRAARSAVRMHSSDQSAVVLTVDDRTLNALNTSDPRRSDDAKLLDELFRLGARRVFFDRVYADTTVPAEDQQLVEAFERHRPNVFIGAMAPFKQADGRSVALMPNPVFRPHAGIVSLTGFEGPLGLSTKFPGHSDINGQIVPSLSTMLAQNEPFEGRYRVDFSTRHESVPILGYIDVLRGRVAESAIKGRDVVIAPSSRQTNDFHPVPFRNPIPGAVIHVLGAETLKKGLPRDFSWYPAFALVALLASWQARRQRPSRRVFGAAVGVLLIAPVGLDIYNVNVDVVPALLALSIAWLRLHRLAIQTYRGATGLKRIESLHDRGVATAMDVVALKIRNFATISANLTPDEIEELLTKAESMLRATESDAQFAFEKDTFVWLRPHAALGELENHVRGLHALFRTSITIGSQTPDVASSIGIDTIADATLRERIENAIQCAEDAAHANRIFMVSEVELAADRSWRLQMLTELENAIRTGEVDVVFQPKVLLTTEAIVGAEALMRWNHPERGPIDPSMVIASAEEHNRVDMITQFVLERALREGRKAIAVDPSFKVAVNVSALDLGDPAFVGMVKTLLSTHRFPVGNLMLEITETAPIQNNQTVAVTLAGLKRMGVRLSVDDFGIGHASLHYLRQIPADEVKIDRSFIAGMESSTEDRALVRTAIDMIHSLGRTAVAEGVENKASVELLREMGCDIAQGYFYYRPITMETLLGRLQDGAIAA